MSRPLHPNLEASMPYPSPAPRFPAAPLARFVWLLCVLVVVSGCRDTPAPTEVEAGGQTSALEDENVVTTLANDGPGSLRDRVFFAAPGSTITFADNLAGQTITVASPIRLDHTLTIEGPASGGIIISGGGATQVFSGAIGITTPTVTLRNLTITGADAGDLFGGHGAGIFNGGITLRIVSSTISGNAGIGVYNPSGDLTIENSTISGNGQVGVDVDGGEATLHHVTITGNAQGLDRNISLVLTNTLLADNGVDCSAAPGIAPNTLGGVNLDSDESCGLDPNFDLVGVDPKLGPLADNGGPTRTHALSFGSPAIDADTPPCIFPVDQRGTARPQGPGCDIGAYERIPISVTLTIGPSGTVNPKTGVATVSGSMTCSLPLAVELQIKLTQLQMVRRVPIPKESTATATVACTSAGTWTVAVVPPSGSAFLNGTATVEAEAQNSDSPSATSRSVRLFWAKK
jgi:Right handed beta helix region